MTAIVGDLLIDDVVAVPADITPGPAGPAGPQGVQGDSGAPGADGAAGPQGPPGADGAPGAQGPQGIQGVPGADGADGAAGAQGIQGPPGADGAQGIQGVPGPPTIVRATVDTVRSVTALADITGLSFAVLVNQDYQFTAHVLFSSAATTTGLGLAVTCPAGAAISYTAEIPNGADAAAGCWHGFGTASDDKVQATGVQAAGTNYVARINCIVRVGATPGNVQLRVASEVAASAVTVKIGSLLVWMKTT